MRRKIEKPVERPVVAEENSVQIKLLSKQLEEQKKSSEQFKIKF